MSLNFDQLLDNDYLTPDQERFVRKLFNYIIEEIEDPIPPQKYLLQYSYKKNPDKINSALAAPTLSALKNQGFKIAMMHLVNGYSNKVKCGEKRNKIRQAILEGEMPQPVDARQGFVLFKYREDEKFQCPASEYIKFQNIYQSLVIILSEID